MKNFGLFIISMAAMISLPMVGRCDIYEQNFDSYSEGASIGTTNPAGPSTSAEQVTSAAKIGSTGMGWSVSMVCNSGSRKRSYDNNASFSLTDTDSFTFSFWVNPYTQANSAANCGFVGLFNSASTANSSNGLASMKYFIGINPGGVGTSRDPALAFQADFQGGGHQQSTVNSTIVGGLNQWYEVVITYDADIRTFDYKVYNESDTQLITDTYTINGTTTFTVDTFGYSNGIATDGRSAKVYVDNVSIVPEPATMALIGLGSLFLIRRRK